MFDDFGKGGLCFVCFVNILICYYFILNKEIKNIMLFKGNL